MTVKYCCIVYCVELPLRVTICTKPQDMKRLTFLFLLHFVAIKFWAHGLSASCPNPTQTSAPSPQHTCNLPTSPPTTSTHHQHNHGQRRRQYPQAPRTRKGSRQSTYIRTNQRGANRAAGILMVHRPSHPEAFSTASRQRCGWRSIQQRQHHRIPTER